MLTGAYPHRTGIIGNDWRDPATGATEYCAGDAAHTYIGHKTEKLDGTSPKNLLVESLGDVLKRVNPRSKVIAISGKDRGAILPAGKAGTAYMYQASSGQFATSTYYMKEHPAWVADWNARKPADKYFTAEWKLLLPESAYARSLADEQKWYAKGGKLPQKPAEGLDAPGPRFCSSLIRSPFSDELTLDFARAAIAESRLSHDHMLHMDRALQAFLRDVDAAIGKDRYVAVLTSDHGFTPAPEHSTALGRSAGRFNLSGTLTKMNGELEKIFGAGKWIHGRSASTVLFNRKLAAEKNVELPKVVEEVRKRLLAEPAVAVAYTSAELASGARAGAPHFDAMRKAAHPERSGELHVTLKPYWIISSGSGSAATHGAPHPEDTHVPLALYGPAWVKAGRSDPAVEIVQIAPTLARILGVPPPSAAEGKPLPLW